MPRSPVQTNVNICHRDHAAFARGGSTLAGRHLQRFGATLWPFCDEVGGWAQNMYDRCDKTRRETFPVKRAPMATQWHMCRGATPQGERRTTRTDLFTSLCCIERGTSVPTTAPCRMEVFRDTISEYLSIILNIAQHLYIISAP